MQGEFESINNLIEAVYTKNYSLGGCLLAVKSPLFITLEGALSLSNEQKLVTSRTDTSYDKVKDTRLQSAIKLSTGVLAIYENKTSYFYDKLSTIEGWKYDAKYISMVIPIRRDISETCKLYFENPYTHIIRLHYRGMTVETAANKLQGLNWFGKALYVDATKPGLKEALELMPRLTSCSQLYINYEKPRDNESLTAQEEQLYLPSEIVKYIRSAMKAPQNNITIDTIILNLEHTNGPSENFVFTPLTCLPLKKLIVINGTIIPSCPEEDTELSVVQEKVEEVIIHNTLVGVIEDKDLDSIERARFEAVWCEDELEYTRSNLESISFFAHQPMWQKGIELNTKIKSAYLRIEATDLKKQVTKVLAQKNISKIVLCIKENKEIPKWVPDLLLEAKQEMHVAYVAIAFHNGEIPYPSHNIHIVPATNCAEIVKTAFWRPTEPIRIKYLQSCCVDDILLQARCARLIDKKPSFRVERLPRMVITLFCKLTQEDGPLAEGERQLYCKAFETLKTKYSLCILANVCHINPWEQNNILNTLPPEILEYIGSFLFAEVCREYSIDHTRINY